LSQESAGEKIFLSYASEDREAAARIARALENQGFSVWWDKDIPTGVNYPKFIETALKSAGCVMVLWSHASTSSRWVRNEADWGAENNTLVPVLIESVEIPWEFRNIQTLNLSEWSGDEDDEVFQRLMTGLKHLVTATGQAPDVSQITDVPKSAGMMKRASGSGRKGLWAALTLAVIALAVMWGTGNLPWGGGGVSDRPTETGISYTTVNGGGFTRSSCLSPDGKYLAMTPMTGRQSSLILSQVDTGSERVLVEMGEHGIRSPIFSPDGGYVYFAMAGSDFSMGATAPYDLYRMPILGHNPQKLAEGIIGRRFACSPDGTKVVYKRSAGDSTLIQTASADGSGEKTIYVEPRNLTVGCTLTWSPHDDSVVTAQRDAEAGHVAIVSIPSGGGEPRMVGTNYWQAVMDVCALADGSGLLVVGMPISDSNDRNLNVWNLYYTDGLSPITDDITNYYQVSADSAGDKLALTYYSATRTLRVVDLNEGGRARNISTDEVSKGRVVWVAPGQLVVNQQAGNRTGVVQVDLASRRNSQITMNVDYVSEIDVSDDGQQMAYTAFKRNEDVVWVSSADGSSPRRLTAEGERETYPQFAPDGSWLVTMNKAAPDQPWKIRRQSLEDGSITEIGPGAGLWPRISPDGSQIAGHFFNEEAGGYGLGVVSSEGGNPTFLQMNQPFEFHDWSPDGKSLTCSLPGDGFLGLHDLPLDGSEPRRVTEIEIDSERITSMAWNTTGDSLAVCLQMATFDVLLVEGVRKPGKN